MVRGVVVLVEGDREVARWPLDLAGDAIDVGAVDYVACLQLAAKRLGLSIRVAHLCPRVRELLDLAGLGDWVEMER